jgi:hypothetical protein
VARLNVHLPDDLAARVREAGLDLSAVTRDAVRRTLAARSTDAWLAGLPTADDRPPPSHGAALRALDAARQDAPTRGG